MSNVLSLRLPIPIRYRLTLNFKIFYLIIPLVITLLIFYVFQINSVVSESYQIQKYQKKINELAEESKFLEINSVKVNSLENIDARIQELCFERVGKIHYIQVLEGSVVTK